MTVIKYWAMYHKLSGSDGNRTEIINNYAVSLLVIFYLQKEQILPNVKTLQRGMDKKDSIIINMNDKRVETGFPNNISLWHSAYCLPEKYQTMTHLLHGFFQFYSNFDYKQLKISPNTGIPNMR